MKNIESAAATGIPILTLIRGKRGRWRDPRRAGQSSDQRQRTGFVVTKPFEVHESGAFLHGTKANLSVGDLLVPGRQSNYGEGRHSNHVYVTQTLDAAVWGAELALGKARVVSTSWNRKANWRTTPM